MFRKILLAGAALATLSAPVGADAQRYRTYGNYGHGRHYYWDGHHYRDRNNHAIVDALIGGVLGYAIGAASAGSYAYPYGYSYPNYGYSYPSYGYGSYYSYPSYGYGYQYSYPRTYRNCGYYRC